MEGLSGDAEVLGGESSIFPSHGIVEHHPLHSQPLVRFKVEKIGYSPPGFISILLDNGFSFKKVETGWLPHSGNSHGKFSSLNIP